MDVWLLRQWRLLCAFRDSGSIGRGTLERTYTMILTLTAKLLIYPWFSWACSYVSDILMRLKDVSSMLPPLLTERESRCASCE